MRELVTGIKFNEADRSRELKATGMTSLLELEGTRLRPSFWHNSSELHSSDIGRWVTISERLLGNAESHRASP
jgi:hypothetical protein